MGQTFSSLVYGNAAFVETANLEIEERFATLSVATENYFSTKITNLETTRTTLVAKITVDRDSSIEKWEGSSIETADIEDRTKMSERDGFWSSVTTVVERRAVQVKQLSINRNLAARTSILNFVHTLGPADITLLVQIAKEYGASERLISTISNYEDVASLEVIFRSAQLELTTREELKIALERVADTRLFDVLHKTTIESLKSSAESSIRKINTLHKACLAEFAEIQERFRSYHPIPFYFSGGTTVEACAQRIATAEKNCDILISALSREFKDECADIIEKQAEINYNNLQYLQADYLNLMCLDGKTFEEFFFGN